MQIKNTLRLWLWKWHFIAGLLSLPFILLLSLTGIIYLFKEPFEQAKYEHLKAYQPTATVQAVSLQEQMTAAQTYAATFGFKPLNHFYLPNESETTVFFNGRFSPSEAVYVNPETGEVVGHIQKDQTIMQNVRKLHGELLLQKYGTKVIELVASWLVVLIVSGIILWWPSKDKGLKSLVQIRWHKGKKVFLRDLHAVLGFWSSAVLFVILAGGLPWTDFFGDNYKRVQEATNSGYPSTWFSNRSLESTPNGLPMSIEAIEARAAGFELPGLVKVTLPANETAVVSVSNTADKLSEQQVIHFDQYSGSIVKHHTWDEVGIMAAGRQVVMRLHMGQFFGWGNWLIILLTALGLSVLSVSILIAYVMRKPKNALGIPNVPETFKPSLVLWVVIVALGIVLPLFGFSVLVILVVNALLSLKKRMFNKQQMA